LRLSGHRERKGYIPNGRSVGILEIVIQGVIYDIGCRAPDSGNIVLLFQLFTVSAHGRSTAVSTGYPEHGRVTPFGYFFQEFRLLHHVEAFD